MDGFDNWLRFREKNNTVSPAALPPRLLNLPPAVPTVAPAKPALDILPLIDVRSTDLSDGLLDAPASPLNQPAVAGFLHVLVTLAKIETRILGVLLVGPHHRKLAVRKSSEEQHEAEQVECRSLHNVVSVRSVLKPSNENLKK